MCSEFLPMIFELRVGTVGMEAQGTLTNVGAVRPACSWSGPAWL